MTKTDKSLPNDGDTARDRGGIQVIARAADILRALGDTRKGMSLGQIAEAVGLPRSTVQRIVGALQHQGFIVAGANAGRLRLGPEIVALAESARTDVVETCRLVLAEISQATGETADLSALRGPAMVFLDQIPGKHRLGTVSFVGEAFPLTTTANGRACLAMLPGTEARALIRAEWDRQGIAGDLTAFEQRLARIREDGLALDLDEHTAGISAAGFAFRDAFDKLYAISVPVPSTRFAEVRPAVEAALHNAARHIQTLLK